jgi:micrococcal nuclease
MKIRHSKNTAILLLLALLILPYSLTRVFPSKADETTSRSATVTRVIDGDTIEVRFDDGQNETVRLIGVDTPETHVPNDPAEFEGIESRAWLRLWGKRAKAYAKRRLLGKQVELLTDTNVQNRGYFDRLLRYVYVDDQQFNLVLIKEGYARVYASEFRRKETFLTFQKTASLRRNGLWGESVKLLFFRSYQIAAF